MSPESQSTDLFLSCESFPIDSLVAKQSHIVMPSVSLPPAHHSDAPPPRRKSTNPERLTFHPQQHAPTPAGVAASNQTGPSTSTSMPRPRSKVTMSVKGATALATPGITASQVTLSTIPLGRGSFGSVWRGTFAGSPVAIKVCPLINPDNPGENSLKDRKAALQHFNRETKRFYHLRHPCIVQFFCVVHHAPSNSLLLVTELMKGGSLYQGLGVLRKNGAKMLPLRVMLRLGIHIANGLAYLHACEFSFGDLKSMNVLLSEPPDLKSLSFSRSTQAKLCDFGLSRNLNRLVPMETHVPGRNGPAGTFAYLAPEAFSGLPVDDGAAPKAADVYALAIVLWELATLRSPWPGKQPLQLLKLVVKEGKRPPWGAAVDGGELPDGYVALVEACWQKEARSRPTAAQVAAALAAMIEAVDEAPLSPVQSLATGFRRRSLSSLSDSHQALALAFGADLKANLQRKQSLQSPVGSHDRRETSIAATDGDGVHDDGKDGQGESVCVDDELVVEGCTHVTEEDAAVDDGNHSDAANQNAGEDDKDVDDDLGSDIVDVVVSSDDEDSDSDSVSSTHQLDHSLNGLLRSSSSSSSSSLAHPASSPTHSSHPALDMSAPGLPARPEVAEGKLGPVSDSVLLLSEERPKVTQSAVGHLLNIQKYAVSKTGATSTCSLPSPYCKSESAAHGHKTSSMATATATAKANEWFEKRKFKMNQESENNFIQNDYNNNIVKHKNHEQDDDDDVEQFLNDFKVYKNMLKGEKVVTSSSSAMSGLLSPPCRDELLSTVISDVSSASHRTHATGSSVEFNPSLPVHLRESDTPQSRRFIMPHVDSAIVADELSELERENEIAFDAVSTSMFSRPYRR